MGRVVMLLELGSTNFSQNLRIASLYLEGPSIYYFRKTNGWVGLQNGQFCWRSVYCIYADIEGGWVKKVLDYADVIYGWSLSRLHGSILDKKNWSLYLGLHLSCCHATLATFDQEPMRTYTMAFYQAKPIAKGSLISKGLLTFVSLPKKGVKSCPWAKSLNFPPCTVNNLYSNFLLRGTI